MSTGYPKTWLSYWGVCVQLFSRLFGLISGLKALRLWGKRLPGWKICLRQEGRVNNFELYIESLKHSIQNRVFTKVSSFLYRLY